MNHQFLTLESDRLILRDFTLNDWNEVFIYQSNPQYLKYYPCATRNEQEVINLVNLFITWQHEIPRNKFQLAIILKNENKLIGNCGIRKNNTTATQADMGCELNPHYWGQGIAREAIIMLLNYSFKQLKLHRIWATTKEENLAAISLVKKLNFKYEGKLREDEWLHDHWSNSLVYAILESEWRTIQYGTTGINK
jgi:[ribosomal protein S5]-alanine N-acetyltransferase